MAISLRIALVCVAGLICSATPARADWYALSNRTERVVVVEEVVPMQGRPMRVKPKRLAPTETARELLKRPAEKHLVIYDPEHPARPLYDGTISVAPGRGTFEIRDHRGGVRVVPEPREFSRR